MAHSPDVPRSSAYPLIPMSVAISTITSSLRRLPSVPTPIANALSLTTTERVLAPAPHPPFRASVKDGYAVSCDSPPLSGVASLAPSVHAGASSTVPLSAHQAAYITTGAPVPDGAHAVAMVENSEPAGNGKVRINPWPKRGDDIRKIGADIEEGQAVLEEGARIGAAEIGILATCGVSVVTCVRPVVIGVMSTGDELHDIASSEDMPTGKIVDSNRPMLLAAIAESLPFCKSRDLGAVQDSYGELKDAIANALTECDIVVTTGGVSMGNKDLVKSVLDELGTVHFGRVLMKPGKPLTFATMEGGRRCVVALPGNPVSAFVCFHLAVCSAAKTLAGWPSVVACGTVIDVILEHGFPLDAKRPEFHRATLKWTANGYVAKSTGAQASSRLLSTRSADALLALPAGSEPMTAGSTVRAYLLRT